jgi:hypothetical protein
VADAGDVVVSWLTKIVVISALLGLIGFDAISIGVSRMSVVDDANSAVQAASQAWQSNHHNIELAYQAAQEALPDPTSEEVEVKGFQVQSDGTVQLTVTKTARTLLLHHVHRFAHYAVVSATESGKSIGS